jgi:hypothetical protein
MRDAVGIRSPTLNDLADQIAASEPNLTKAQAKGIAGPVRSLWALDCWAGISLTGRSPPATL